MSKFIKILGLDEATRLDVVSSTISYLGKASIASATSNAVWKISRLTSTVGGNITIEYADSGRYTQIWDGRLSLSYQ